DGLESRIGADPLVAEGRALRVGHFHAVDLESEAISVGRDGDGGRGSPQAIASFVMARPRVLPGWKPIGIASSMSLLVTRTSCASGAQIRNLTRPSASCSTDRYAAGEVNMPFGRQSAGAAGACLVVESEAVV